MVLFFMLVSVCLCIGLYIWMFLLVRSFVLGLIVVSMIRLLLVV